MNNCDIRRLAFFLQDIDGGGAERSVIHLANHLALSGYSVDLVVGDANSDYRDEIANEVRLFDFATRSKANLIFGLIKYLRSNRPPVIMSALDLANYMLLFSAKLVGFKGRVVFSQRASTIDESRKKNLFRRALFILAEKLLLKRADLIISNSYAAAREIVNKGAYPSERIYVIPNSVNVDRVIELSCLPLDVPSISELGEEIVLSVGSVTKRKDFETLVKAFKVVRTKRNVRLVILGRGYEPDEFERIRNLVNELDLAADVTMPGFDSNPYRWMRAASVLVSSSRNEGFPNNLAEGLALNCRIVATDCPGDTAWLLGHGRWGRLVPVGDHLAMAESVLDALDDKSPITTINRANEFSPEKVYRAYSDLLLF